MEVIGRLPYIAGDVDRLWNSIIYNNKEVDKMIEEGAVYEARIYTKGRPRRVALIGSAVSFDNSRKIFYLMKERGNNLKWTCRSLSHDSIDKIKILDDVSGKRTL